MEAFHSVSSIVNMECAHTWVGNWGAPPAGGVVQRPNSIVKRNRCTGTSGWCITVLLLLLTTIVKNANAVCQVVNKGSIALNTGEDSLKSAFAYDDHLFYVTYTSPGTAIKVDPSTDTRVGAVSGLSGEDLWTCGVQYGGFGFFAGDTDPSYIVKVDLSSMTRIGAITASYHHYTTAQLDGQYAYFISSPSNVFSYIEQIDLSTFTIYDEGLLYLGTGDGNMSSGAAYGGYHFFATTQSPGRIIKTTLSSFSIHDRLKANNGENVFTAMAISGAFAYVTCYTSPGKLVKFNLDTMTRVGAVSGVDSSESYFTSVVIPSSGTFAYVTTIDDPSLIVRFNVETMTRLDTASAAASQTALVGPLSYGQYHYYCTSTSDPNPGVIAKFALEHTCTTTPTAITRITVTSTKSASASSTTSLSHTASLSPSLSRSLSDSVSPTATSSPSASASIRPSASLSPLASRSPTHSLSVTLSASFSPPSFSPTESRSPADSASPTATTSASPSVSVSQSPSQSDSATLSVLSSHTASLSPTDSVMSPTDSVSPAATTSPSLSSVSLSTSASRSLSLNVSATASASFSPTNSLAPTFSANRTETTSSSLSTPHADNSTSTTPSSSHSGRTETPAHTATQYLVLTDGLTTTTVRVVLNGTRWSSVMATNATEVLSALRKAIAVALNMPESNIVILGYSIGSLIVRFEVTRNNTFATDEATLAAVLGQDAAYEEALALYRSLTNETAALNATIELTTTTASTASGVNIPLVVGVSVGVGGFLLLLGAVAAVMRQCYLRRRGSQASSGGDVERGPTSQNEPTSEA